MREFLNTDRWTMPETAARGRRELVVPLRRVPQYEAMLPQLVATAHARARPCLAKTAVDQRSLAGSTDAHHTKAATVDNVVRFKRETSRRAAICLIFVP